VGGLLLDGLWSKFEVPPEEFDVDDATLEAAVAARCDKENVESDDIRKAARDDMEAFCAGLRSRRSAPSPEHGGEPQGLRRQNPLAVGEMINHPPVGRAANVLGWPVDLDLSREGYAQVAPNTFALRPQGSAAPGAPSPYTVVMVAAHALKPGDELFLDYGSELLDVEDIPPWFTPAALRGDANEKDPRKSPALAIRDELRVWSKDFEARHGRTPTRHDLLADPVSTALFETFQKYRKLGDL
ncbi:unnamed protein product, partial [Polarella glacialis]